MTVPIINDTLNLEVKPQQRIHRTFQQRFKKSKSTRKMKTFRHHSHV